MSSPQTYAYFISARSYVDSAVQCLENARKAYAAADLPDEVRRARLAAIDAKVDALRAVHLDQNAHPWAEDGVLQ